MPSIRRPEPKKQGVRLRRATAAATALSVRAPVSKYSSIRASSHMAHSSYRPASSRPKSTQGAPSALRRSESTFSRSAPGRSIFVTKMKVGMALRCKSCQRVRVWACTPSVPLMTRMP